MHLTILTPDSELYAGDIISVKIPGVAGQFEILNNHAPIVSALGNGTVRVKKLNGEDLTFQIKQGFIEVLNNEISLLVTV
jgi:F-type H+-transporting ATPase subunit epsilon